MTDTSTSSPPEERTAKRDAKKEKRKHRKQTDSAGGGSEKKHGKSKKKEKRQRNSSTPDRSDDDDRSERRRKKKREKKHKHHKPIHDHDEPSRRDEKMVSSSAIEYYPPPLKSAYMQQNSNTTSNNNNTPSSSPTTKSSSAPQAETITLLLFYQYVEPPWTELQFRKAYEFVQSRGELYRLTGRMRVAREGLNCTLTGSYRDVRDWCNDLRQFDGRDLGNKTVTTAPDDGDETSTVVTEFANTEFKLTDDLPPKQRFPKLHAFEVVELVNYGLAGGRAPEIGVYGGRHLEPKEYHEKMCEEDTVIIDVRNHYEANVSIYYCYITWFSFCYLHWVGRNNILHFALLTIVVTLVSLLMPKNIDWKVRSTRKGSQNDRSNDEKEYGISNMAR